MRFFREENRQHPRQKQLYAAYEIAYTLVDFMAAAFFVVGSAFFFFSGLQTPALWCFLLGSILFAVKPLLKLTREIHLARIGDVDDLARRERAEP